MPKLDTFNAVVLGAGGVGKSALTVRWGRNEFLEQYNPTIEEEYRCTADIDGERCILNILDTPGAEQFTGLTEGHIKFGQGFILVFSLIDERSLKELDLIRHQIYQTKGMDVPIVVVGTKMDLAHEREVSRGTVQDLALRWGHSVYETSAKRNWHVSDPFEDLVRQMRKRYPRDAYQRRRKRDVCVVM
ncbi:ras-domain-containing protein [Obba rivulosa]|uniref:Ras-domain-containing protein n=1 Tax=Obba rivulosa TaxID=1052685 RepID=A0A8E2DSA1_9APHY|nr:ras-domain-containing protein [Obba rivulosa]